MHKNRGLSRKCNNNIKEILKEIGMSQIELSDITNIDTAHLSRIISKAHLSVSVPIAIIISKALNRPVEEVFTPIMK